MNARKFWIDTKVAVQSQCERIKTAAQDVQELVKEDCGQDVWHPGHYRYISVSDSIRISIAPNNGSIELRVVGCCIDVSDVESHWAVRLNVLILALDELKACTARTIRKQWEAEQLN